MVVSLSFLQLALLTSQGSLVEPIQWDTRLCEDLGLSDPELHNLLEEIFRQMNVPIPVDTNYNLADVFDLVAYVLLRSTETLTYLPAIDVARKSAPPILQSVYASDFPQFSDIACQLEACLPVYCNPETNVDLCTIRLSKK